MLIDIAIVVLTVAMAVRGYVHGVRTALLVCSRIRGGSAARFAPGTTTAGWRPARPVRPRSCPSRGASLRSRAGGRDGASRRQAAATAVQALLARRARGCGAQRLLAVVLVSALAVAAARIGGLDAAVRASYLVGRLHALLPPPGPILTPSDPYPESLSQVASARETPELRVKQDPEVKAAAASVVKIAVTGCEGRGSGSGGSPGTGSS